MCIRRAIWTSESRISAKAGVRLFCIFRRLCRAKARDGTSHVISFLLGAELGTSAPGRASEKRKGAKSLNEKVYKSARELRSAIDRYFASICYREPVTRTEPVLEDREFIRNGERVVMQCPALDKYGHTQTAVVPVMRGKKPLMREVWIRPPCMPELLGALGLDEKQWDAMRTSEEFAKTCARAGARIEIYNIQRLDSSAANGAKFHLERKFGWDEKTSGTTETEIELPEEIAQWRR